MKHALTKRQREVLACMMDGLTHRQIAKRLDMSTLSTQGHIVQIWNRLCMPQNRAYALQILMDLLKRLADDE